MKRLKTIEDFFIPDVEFLRVPPEVEKEINEYMDRYNRERELREFEAIERAKHIFLNR